MANECTYLPEPTSTPLKVSEAYQRQNTNLAAQRNGIDRTIVEAGAGPQVKCMISGPVDFNGVLYVITSQANLTITGGADRYYIYLNGSGNSLTPTLTTDPGTFSDSKNARYTVAGYRILNWVIDYNGSNVDIKRWDPPIDDVGRLIDGNVDVEGNIDIGGDVSVDGDTSLSGSLAVGDDVTLSANKDVKLSGSGRLEHGGTPVAGYLSDGTPYYIKEISVTITNGQNSGFAAHGISNAYTNDRIFNVMARRDEGTGMNVTHDSDYNANYAVVSYQWGDSNFALVRVGSTTTYTWTVTIFYI